MVMQDKLTEAFNEAGLSQGEVQEFAGTDAFRMALQCYANARAERSANGRAGGVSRIIQEVEFSTYPFTDEGGHYVPYKCALCGTKAKVRQMKRVRGAKVKDEQRQQDLPGTEESK